VNAVARVDAFQQRHRWLGLPLAVFYKFYDDHGPYLAALLTYYGFLSLFPLLLLFVSALGAFLENNPDVQQRALNSVFGEFPVLGDQLERNVHSFHSNGFALAVGVVASLYGSLNVAQAAQYALNKIWAVPRHARLDPFRSRWRGIQFLLVLVLGLAVTTMLSTAAAEAGLFGARLAAGTRVLVTLAVIGLNAGLLLVTYQLLTHRVVPLRRVWGSALAAAVAWQGLQWAGDYFVSHVLRGASSTYGFFGIVLGLIAWLYVGALVFVLAAEASAVRAHRLWPRSLLTPFTDHVQLSSGDRRAYTSYATTETFKGFEDVHVDFRQRPPTDGGDPDDEAPPAPDGSR
jgi:YihY family inner membrane protein